MRRPNKLRYEVTCFDSWWWHFNLKCWVQILGEQQLRYHNVGSHAPARNMKQAVRLARSLQAKGAKDVSILRWSWPKGKRKLSEITLR